MYKQEYTNGIITKDHRYKDGARKGNITLQIEWFQAVVSLPVAACLLL